MKRITILAGLCAAALAVPAVADVDGSALYQNKCASCHGPQGKGQGMFPRVMGLAYGDAVSKLKAYRAGEQVGPNTSLMAPNAANLTDEEIAAVASFLSQNGQGEDAGTAASSEGSGSGASQAEGAGAGPDVEAGRSLYQSTCASCHGDKAQGMGNFPALAGQQAANLRAKLKAYRDGQQVGPLSGVMIPQAQGLSDQQIRDVAAFIAHME